MMRSHSQPNWLRTIILMMIKATIDHSLACGFNRQKLDQGLVMHE